jgi:hypothetical protein
MYSKKPEKSIVSSKKSPFFNDMHKSDTDYVHDLLILYYIGYINFFSSQNLNLESLWKLYITTALFSAAGQNSPSIAPKEAWQ